MSGGRPGALGYGGVPVLVTGAGGFIGSHLVRRLAALGARVTALGRSLAPLDRPGAVRAVRGDVRDATLMTALLDEQPAVVFHLAGYSGQVPSFADHSESLTTNCLGLINLLDAVRARSAGTRLVFASSRLVYGRTRYLPVDEEHPREALSLYGIHKRTGEEYCAYYRARWGVDSVVLRLANPYGPHDPAGHNRYNVANWMLDEVAAGRTVTLYGRGEHLRDYVYIDDAIDALLLAGIAPDAAGCTYNVGSGAGTRMADFVDTAIAAAGCGSYGTAPWPADALAVETGDFTAGIARITRELGWRPRMALPDGIAATIAATRTAEIAIATGRTAGSQPPPAVPAAALPAQRRRRRGSQPPRAVPAETLPMPERDAA